MKIVFDRICAYLLDIILVSLVGTIITANSYINIDYKKYNKLSLEYTQYREEYNNFIKEFEKKYDDNKLSNIEYKNLIKNNTNHKKYISNYYKDNKLTKEEYNKVIKKVNKDYNKKSNDYNYQLVKYSKVPTVMSILCILLYFVIIQFYLDGQTLGKKIMKLKVVSNNDKKLNILNYFLRCLILNNVLFNIISFMFLIFLNKNNYIYCNGVVYILTSLVEIINILIIISNKNNRGLHDLIAGTKVIKLK